MLLAGKQAVKRMDGWMDGRAEEQAGVLVVVVAAIS